MFVYSLNKCYPLLASLHTFTLLIRPPLQWLCGLPHSLTNTDLRGQSGTENCVYIQQTRACDLLKKRQREIII